MKNEMITQTENGRENIWLMRKNRETNKIEVNFLKLSSNFEKMYRHAILSFYLNIKRNICLSDFA